MWIVDVGVKNQWCQDDHRVPRHQWGARCDRGLEHTFPTGAADGEVARAGGVLVEPGGGADDEPKALGVELGHQLAQPLAFLALVRREIRWCRAGQRADSAPARSRRW
jgi:hypothetical protein